MSGCSRTRGGGWCATPSSCAAGVTTKRGRCCTSSSSRPISPPWSSAGRCPRRMPARTRRPAELARPYLIPNQIVSMLDAPIIRQGQVVGVICHETVDSPHSLDAVGGGLRRFGGGHRRPDPGAGRAGRAGGGAGAAGPAAPGEQQAGGAGAHGPHRRPRHEQPAGGGGGRRRRGQGAGLPALPGARPEPAGRRRGRQPPGAAAVRAGRAARAGGGAGGSGGGRARDGVGAAHAGGQGRSPSRCASRPAGPRC